MTASSRRDDPRARIDALVDYWAKYKPGERVRIHVGLDATTLGKMLGQLPRKGSVDSSIAGSH